MLQSSLLIAALVAPSLIPTPMTPAPYLPEPAELLPPAGPHDWLIKHPTIIQLVESTNAHRTNRGRAAVQLNAAMCLEAQKHAEWMARTGYYQHSSLPYMEIIHRGPTTPEAAVQGWIYSPAHHGILLSGRQCGFGYMKRNGVTYWVGVFR